MRYVGVSLLLVLIAGCGAPMKVVVYGGSGKQYMAPDLCAAQVQCMLAKEQVCYHNVTVLTRPDGSGTEMEACKTAR